MSSFHSIISEPSVPIASLLLLAFVTLVFGTGIYVVSGRWGAARPKRDAKAIARWNEAQQEGFWRVALRRHLLLSFLLSYTVVAHFWTVTPILSLSSDSFVRALLLAPLVILVEAGMDWFSLRRQATEAHERAARLQDEQNEERLSSRFRHP